MSSRMSAGSSGSAGLSQSSRRRVSSCDHVSALKIQSGLLCWWWVQ